MEINNDLDFLFSFWAEAKAIGQKILNELPQTKPIVKKKLKQGLLNFVNFSDVNDTWDVKYYLNNVSGQSKTLKILAEKINYMILKGRANDVKTMLLRIVNKGVKNLVQPEHSEWELMLKDGNEKRRSLGNIGKGHFRWDYGAHTLNDIEIKRIIDYFNILS